MIKDETELVGKKVEKELKEVIKREEERTCYRVREEEERRKQDLRMSYLKIPTTNMIK